MDQYEVIKKVHRIGHRISGTVTGHKITEAGNGWKACNINMKTDSDFISILPYSNLFDEYDYNSFDEKLIPAIGTHIEMVVMNYVDGTLYLSARPGDVKETRVADFANFYSIAEALDEGAILTGKVVKAMPFGLFVELPCPYAGLLEIGGVAFNNCAPLPRNSSEWPQIGDSITCRTVGFRFHNKQIALCWLPTDAQL